MLVVIGGDNLPSPVGIGLTDLPNIGRGPVDPLPPPPPPGSGIVHWFKQGLVVMRCA